MKTTIRQFVAWALMVLIAFPGLSFAQVASTPEGVVNQSTRVTLNATDPFFITGFVIAGKTSKTVLIRAIGPGLTDFGVTGANTDPRIELFRGDGAPLAGNDDWGVLGSSSFTLDDKIRISAQVGAFALKAGSFDASLLVTLAPGSYTARIAGSRGELGTVLLEFYIVP